ncbi:MAG: hypothetical protein PHW60_01110 [Kiritimatiellae bacterium]|nr:hypothetical protein [Kiritimatiellia bacterium]
MRVEVKPELLRRVAQALDAEVKVVFESAHGRKNAVVAAARTTYGKRT